ncbi:hypothetical protein [Alicyclobacillus dauci]|uniref:Uncharacterized protein n=1 Tax=Alicyclobacillus dauci TaxID=1475485 RepID=A0ABY6Z8C3_9BACL|nr:hypothetical protein [Alicyclobacillus dauci]WAH38511.1 hypothetical protein NZD86_08530 [Alicyclobacillus dauci]
MNALMALWGLVTACLILSRAAIPSDFWHYNHLSIYQRIVRGLLFGALSSLFLTSGTWLGHETMRHWPTIPWTIVGRDTVLSLILYQSLARINGHSTTDPLLSRFDMNVFVGIYIAVENLLIGLSIAMLELTPYASWVICTGLLTMILALRSPRHLQT